MGEEVTVFEPRRGRIGASSSSLSVSFTDTTTLADVLGGLAAIPPGDATSKSRKAVSERPVGQVWGCKGDKLLSSDNLACLASNFLTSAGASSSSALRGSQVASSFP